MSSPPSEDDVCITVRVMWIPPTVDTTGNPRKRKFSDAQEVVTFVVFAQPDDNLAVVWRTAEREFTKAYGGEKVDLRYFSHMKVNTADVFPWHKVSLYFKRGRPPGENLLYFVQSDKDRESSIPVHSTLRPSWFTPPALGAPLKRRKVHGAEHGMTVDQIDPERPVESNERTDEGADDRDDAHVHQPTIDADGFAVPAIPANRKTLVATSRRSAAATDASQATVLVQDSQAPKSQIEPQLATHPMWLKKQGAKRQHSAPLVHSSPTESAATRAKTSAPHLLQLNQPHKTPLTVSANREHESNTSKGHGSIPTPPSVDERVSDPHEAPTSAQRHSSRTPQFEDARNYFRRTSHSNPNTDDPIVDEYDFMDGIDDDEILNGLENVIDVAEDADYVPPGAGRHRRMTRSQSLESIPPEHFVIDRTKKLSSQLPAVSSLPVASDVPSSEQPSSTNAFDALLSSQESRLTQRHPSWSKGETIALLKGLKKSMTNSAIIKAFKLNRTASSCRNHKRYLLTKFPKLKIPPEHEYYALVETASASAAATPGTATPVPATAIVSTPDIVVSDAADPATATPQAIVPVSKASASTSLATTTTVNVLLATAAVSSDPVSEEIEQELQQADSPLAILTPRETSAAPEDGSQLKKEPGNDQSKLGFKRDRRKGIDGPSRAALRAAADKKYGPQRATSARARLQERYDSTHGGTENTVNELPNENDYVMSGGLGVAEGRKNADEARDQQPNPRNPEDAEDGPGEWPNPTEPEITEEAQERQPDQASYNTPASEPTAERPISPAKSELSLTDSDKNALRDIDHTEEDEVDADSVAEVQQPNEDMVMEDAGSRPSTAGSGPGKQLSQELQQSAEGTPEQSLETTPLSQTDGIAVAVVEGLYDLRTFLKPPNADGKVLIGRPEHPVVFAVAVIESDEKLLKEAKNLRKKQKHLVPLQFELNRWSVQHHIAMSAGDIEGMDMVDKELKPRQVFLELVDRGKIDEHDDFEEWLEQFDKNVDWNEEWEALENNPPSELIEEFFEDCDDGYGALVAEEEKDDASVSHRGLVEEVFSEDEGEDDVEDEGEGQADLNMQKRVEATAQEGVEVKDKGEDQIEIEIPSGAEDQAVDYEASAQPIHGSTEATETDQNESVEGMSTATSSISTESKAERKRRKKQEKAERRAAQGRGTAHKTKRRRSQMKPAGTNGR